MNKIKHMAFRGLFGPAVAAAFAVAVMVAAVLVPPPGPARAQLAAAQTWAGSAGGTSIALTLTVHNIASLNDLLGVPIRFIPTGTSNAPSTLTVTLDNGSTLPPTPIMRPTSNLGIQPIVSDIQTGMLTELTYDGTEFVITSSVDMTAIGRTVDFRGSSGPLGSLLEDGSCQLTATYPSLSAVILGIYGSCSAGSFKLPNSQGTNFLAADNGAGRITTATCSAPSTVGTLCGNQTHLLTAAEIPANLPYTDPGHSHIYPVGNSTSAGSLAYSGSVNSNTLSTQTSVTGIVINPSGGGAHSILSPNMIGLRGIKY